MIIGVDYHPSFQEIAFLVEETGECDEGSLKHSNGEAEGNTRHTDIARCDGAPRGHRPRARMEAPRKGTGRSRVHPEATRPGRVGKSKDDSRR